MKRIALDDLYGSAEKQSYFSVVLEVLFQEHLQELESSFSLRSSPSLIQQKELEMFPKQFHPYFVHFHAVLPVQLLWEEQHVAKHRKGVRCYQWNPFCKGADMTLLAEYEAALCTLETSPPDTKDIDDNIREHNGKRPKGQHREKYEKHWKLRAQTGDKMAEK